MRGLSPEALRSANDPLTSRSARSLTPIAARRHQFTPGALGSFPLAAGHDHDPGSHPPQRHEERNPEARGDRRRDDEIAWRHIPRRVRDDATEGGGAEENREL